MAILNALLFATAVPPLFSSSVLADGMYSKTSQVLQVDARNYDRLIANSNHTSILEFYAPWCGHCQNLKPAYEKAAKNLQGLAKVAAINCDEEPNKPFCGSMGVQGFPTLKIVRPSKKPGKPTVEDYQGPRSAKAIADAVADKIPNHVRRVSDQELDKWLEEDQSAPKALLFSDKGTTSALFKALAIDFLGSIHFAQVRDKEKKAVERFGIKTFPTLLVLQGSEQDPTMYDGELKKEPIITFLSKIAPPNPDPAPATEKAKKKPSKDTKKEQQKAMKDSSSFSATSSSHASAEAEEAKATAASITLEDTANPTESPNPNVATDDTAKPIPLPVAPPPIPMLGTEAELSNSCRHAKSPLCILALVPANTDAEAEMQTAADQVLSHLAAISHKHAQRQAKLFPFYAVPGSNPGASNLRELLKTSSDWDIDIIALNAKRSWWKRYDGNDLSKEAIEGWIDSIRMGDLAKEKLPDGIVVAQKAEPEPVEIKLDDLPQDGPIKISLEEVIDEHDEL